MARSAEHPSIYPKRLIEVDLPIALISKYATHEKAIRQGHIANLHQWWARRPLASCRAIVCAALWPDPADPACPVEFRDAAKSAMHRWGNEHLALMQGLAARHFISTVRAPNSLEDPQNVRQALLYFIAEFANYSNSTREEFLTVARALTAAAHNSLGGLGMHPLVVDPFAGGGAIPLEALRVGADAWASDLNPVAVLIEKVILEYLPRYGERLTRLVREWGESVGKRAAAELATSYPADPNGDAPIAYIWARTIRCEGPSCGAEVPLLRSLALSKKSRRPVVLRLSPSTEGRSIDVQIVAGGRAGDIKGTARRGTVDCPRCGYTTSADSVRRQLTARRGGARDARLVAVAVKEPGVAGRKYRSPTRRDLDAIEQSKRMMAQTLREAGTISPVPDEALPLMSGVFNAPIYGHSSWESLFTDRQLLSLVTYCRLIRTVHEESAQQYPADLRAAAITCLALTLDKLADLANSLCRWEPVAECPRQLFGRQAIPMLWDFAEGVPTGDSSGSWAVLNERFVQALKDMGSDWLGCTPARGSATEIALPDNSAEVLFTDPPYYNAVPYADLSDFFYVWLRRTLLEVHPELFSSPLTPKSEEICEMAGWDPIRYGNKNGAWFETEMTRALRECERVIAPGGIGVLVFAHKSTAGWEAILGAMIEAGWVITASWPIDTEMGSRLRAQNSAVLGSSVHLVCRRRETRQIGDWRDVLGELPQRIHAWMPRLHDEGVVGADAIFACLGPALELFSRYDSVEKASGDKVLLSEYLEHVWAAVSREALSLLFADADTRGLESDARVTAMWLWTLSTSVDDGTPESSSEEDSEYEERKPPDVPAGLVLEYDAARKIAQGLGADLSRLAYVVEVKGEVARLLSVAERTRFLFGKQLAQTGVAKPKPRLQMDMFTELAEAEESSSWAISGTPPPGSTTLDRIHQSMILFAAGRSMALQRFLVEQGVGRDATFWRLAQALSALYPSGMDEKRWVDGVLSRKKSLGF